MITLSKIKKILINSFFYFASRKTLLLRYSYLRFTGLLSNKNTYTAAVLLDIAVIALVVYLGIQPAKRLIAPIVEPLKPLHSLEESEVKHSKEIFGFAPFWTFDKLDNVDFNILTTFAYFGVEVDSEGNLDRDSE